MWRNITSNTAGVKGDKYASAVEGTLDFHSLQYWSSTTNLQIYTLQTYLPRMLKKF